MGSVGSDMFGLLGKRSFFFFDTSFFFLFNLDLLLCPTRTRNIKNGVGGLVGWDTGGWLASWSGGFFGYIYLYVYTYILPISFVTRDPSPHTHTCTERAGEPGVNR